MKSNIRVILCTFPNEAIARQIGTLLVEQQLAACVNVIPKIHSIYQWEGKIVEDTEVLALFKTSAETYPIFAKTLQEAHPYHLPEILAITPSEGSEIYQKWVTSNCINP